MPNPSRVQIEATVPLPKYRVQIWYNGAWRLIPDSSIIDVSGDIESTGNIDNGLSFGTEVEPSATIKCERIVLASGGDRLLEDSYWLLHRMMISYGFSTSDYVKTFVGPIRERSINQNELTLELIGNIEYIRNTKFYSPLYYTKPIATKTTAVSVENPASGSYAAGLINRIFWEAGGRPYEQESINYFETDADFKFWYSCEQSILTPDWSWISSENLVDELYALARAAGGQIYQDNNGVMRYVQPFSFADLTPYGPLYAPFEYNDNDFQTYAEKTTSYEQVGTVKCTFTPRVLQPYQNIYEDKIPRFFQPSEVKTLTLETQWPVYTHQTINAACFTVTDLTGIAVTPTIGTIVTNATRIDITITNPSSTVPMIIHAIKIQGRPLGAGEEITVSYGSGDPERNIENNTYIQSEPFAKRLVRMVYDFYASGRAIITLNGAIYDTDRFVGELVKVVSLYNRKYLGSGTYSDNGDLYRIININHSLTGTNMDVDLVNVQGLPTRDQMFLIGDYGYTSGTTRKLSY